MTAIVISTSASIALTDLIASLRRAAFLDEHEMPNLIELLQAIRAKHHAELREARRRVLDTILSIEPLPSAEILRFAQQRLDSLRPSDTEGP